MLRRKTWIATLALAMVAGCNNREAIQSYTVPKTTEPQAKARPAAETTGEVRLLGAFVPTGEPGYNWFVKFSGPSAVVNEAEVEFDQFLASLKYLGEGAARKLDWKAPKGGWPGPAKPGLRLVTFLVGPVEKPVECYISDRFGGDTLSNVNRWREGDAGLSKITEADIPSCTSEFRIGDVKCIRVDLTGPGPVGGKKTMGPFQGK